MRFPHGITIVRERRPRVEDPYTPGKTRWGSWADAEALTIEQVFVSFSGSFQNTQDPDRNPVTFAAMLYCFPGDDITTGDRVIMPDSAIYYVAGLPQSEKNPFTGWQPYLSVPLSGQEG